MLRVVGRSKRGRKQITRHGNKWMPVQADKCVGCLGGQAGIKLMSVQDQATFWIRVEGDENLIVVERLDNFGRPLPTQGRATREIPLTGEINGGAGAGVDGRAAQDSPAADTPQAQRQEDVARVA
jgi:hypothetical protein